MHKGIVILLHSLMFLIIAIKTNFSIRYWNLFKDSEYIASITKKVPHRPYSPDLAPCDFWLFSKLSGCRYVTIEKMKGALTKEDFHGAFQKFLHGTTSTLQPKEMT